MPIFTNGLGDSITVNIPGTATSPLPAPELTGRYIQLQNPSGGGTGLIYFVWKNGLKTVINSPDPYTRIIDHSQINKVFYVDKISLMSIENDLALSSVAKLYHNLSTGDYYFLNTFSCVTVKHLIRGTDTPDLIFNYPVAEEGDGTALRGTLSGEEIYIR